MEKGMRLTERGAGETFSIYLRSTVVSRLADYEDIGTVEELRELKEKATAKKPVREDRWDIPLCPTCGSAGLIEDYDYCSDCGQKIDHEV